MNAWIKAILTKIVGELIENLLTPELIEKVKTDIVLYIAELAKQSDNDLDDVIVKKLADALGVKLP